jgi:hypothetical protein
MPGLDYVKTFFPELFAKPIPEEPKTDPVNEPGPVTPPVIEQPAVVVTPAPELPPVPSVLAYEWKDLGIGRNTRCPVYLVYFPDQPRIVEVAIREVWRLRF